MLIDPLIGAASDRQLARTGSRRGFMVTGALALPLFFALTFAVPPTWGPVAGAISVLLAFLATATAFSLFQVPYVALPAELTGSYLPTAWCCCCNRCCSAPAAPRCAMQATTRSGDTS